MCMTLFYEVISALVRRGSWRQRANLTVLISLVRFINKLQRHEVELEKCVTSIHSAPFVCIWDCFSRLAGQREPIHSTFSPAVWWLRWMGLWSMSRAWGGGAAGRAGGRAEGRRVEKRGKGSAVFLQGRHSGLIPRLLPRPVASISIAAALWRPWPPMSLL